MWDFDKKKMWGVKPHIGIGTMKKMSNLICGKFTAGRNYNLTLNNNSAKIGAFLHFVQRYLYKVLNRRSHKRSYTWDGYIEMLKVYPLAKPKIYVKLF